MNLWYGKPGQEFIHDDLLKGKFNDVLTEKYPEIKQMLLANDFASYFTGLNNVYYGVLFDGGSVDFGCPVDAELTTDGGNPYENFYDLGRISQEMNNYFAP